MCHETRVSYEVLTELDAFLFRPCARKVEDVVRSEKEKKGTVDNQLQISQDCASCVFVSSQIARKVLIGSANILAGFTKSMRE